jgi:hypothetical protein
MISFPATLLIGAVDPTDVVLVMDACFVALDVSLPSEGFFADLTSLDDLNPGAEPFLLLLAVHTTAVRYT